MGEFLQWFIFESMVPREPIAFRITNAGETGYTKGWENYQVSPARTGKTGFGFANHI